MHGDGDGGLGLGDFKKFSLNNPQFVKGPNPFVSSSPTEATTAARVGQAVPNFQFGAGLGVLEEECPSAGLGQRATMPKSLAKARTQKEIVSAMVRLN